MYSYVVLRRGPRPAKPSEELGREKVPAPIAEDEAQSSRQVWVDADESGDEMVLENPSEEPPPTSPSDQPSNTELTDHLRNESYHWPKLIIPPLKKSGHIILDSCNPEGKRNLL